MADIATNFYSNLYKATPASPTTIDNYLLNTPTSTMPIEPITFSQDHISHAINSLANNKAPGIDGLTAEFYKTFADQITPLLLQLFDTLHESDTLPNTLTQGVIILIYKKGNKQDIKNYRPITLLCNDYKILTKLIALQITPTLPYIIHKDQYGFIPGKTIHDNIQLTINHLLHSKATRNQSLFPALFLVDLEKAFDSVSREFLYQTLQHQGFPTSTLHLIQLIHHNSQARISLNGTLTPSLNIASGVRQGCPLAPYLFILAINSLISKVHISNMVGIPTPESDATKILAYADDITIFLSKDSELQTALSELKHFASASNLKINNSKSYIVPYHNNPVLPTQIHSIPVLQQHQSTKVLGISISSTLTPINTWQTLAAKIDATILQWRRLNISLYGRVKISQAYLQSVLTYYAPLLHVPPKILHRIDTSMVSYVQTNNSNLKSKNYRPYGTSLLHLPYPEGGLQFHKPSTYIKSQQVQTIINIYKPPYPSWKIHTIKEIQNTTTLTQNILQSTKEVLRYIKSPKWKAMLQSYFQLNPTPPIPTNAAEFLQQAILFNPNFTAPNSQTFHSPQQVGLCRRYKISTISDLFHSPNGHLILKPTPHSKNIKYLEFYSILLQTIPTHWTHAIITSSIAPTAGEWKRDKVLSQIFYELNLHTPVTNSYNCNIYIAHTSDSSLSLVAEHTEISQLRFLPTNITHHNGTAYVSPFMGYALPTTILNSVATNIVTLTPSQIRQLLSPQPPTNNFITKWNIQLPNQEFKPQKLLLLLKGLNMFAKTKEVTYRLITQSLPLGSRYWTGNLNITCNTCSTTTLETENHLFFNCTYALRLYQCIQQSTPLLNPDITPQEFLSGSLTHTNPYIADFISIPYIIFFHTIWTTRCSAIYKNKIPTIQASLSIFSKKLQLALQTYMAIHKQLKPEKYKTTLQILKQLRLIDPQS
jgi:Reverse transcriptase (RNA-dependent DNA polymerase)